VFQFLIGTVKTRDQHLCQICKQRFQFLIGTVKTSPAAPAGTSRLDVSIPHRYCKNLLPFIVFTLQNIWFQFLIGTVKTTTEVVDIKGVETVSIPHRYCKNVFWFR